MAQTERVPSRVEHDPSACRVAIGGLMESHSATGGNDLGYRCVEVGDQHLKVDHLRLEALFFRPRRGLVPLLGLETEADTAIGVRHADPAGSSLTVLSSVAPCDSPTEEAAVEGGHLVSVGAIQADASPLDPPTVRAHGFLPGRSFPREATRGVAPFRTGGKMFSMQATVTELEDLLRDRRAQRPPSSYSVQLFDDPELIQRKIMEEAFEVCLELGRARRDPERVVSEAADLMFHLLVGLVDSEVSFAAVVDELARRRR
jgi:phosphoribosyl-ATP pyrophosphohydrolase